jgi:predicted nucleotidyltransferase
MTVSSLDFSKKTELRWLSELVRLVQQAAGELPYFIAGATARDLILQYGYGIAAARKTLDVDFATDAAHLLERSDFDYEAAGVSLLGHDMGKLIAGDSRAKVAELLERESNPNGALRLVGDMRADPERLLPLLSALKNGFAGG